MCWDTSILLVCVVLVEESRRVGVLSLPVSSPCNKVVMVLGTGLSFRVGFVLVTEVCVSIGTGSGWSCSSYQLW